MSGFNRAQPQFVSPAPVADTSAPARALASVAGAVANLGQFMQAEGEIIQTANLNAKASEARSAYQQGLDDLEIALDAESDPGVINAKFVAAERELRQRVMPEMPEAFQRQLDAQLTDAALVTGRRVKVLARQRTIQRAEAARMSELESLTNRASVTDDPLELVASRRSIEELLTRDVEAGTLGADRAMALRRQALNTIDGAQLDKSIDGYADAVLAGDDAGQVAGELIADLRDRGAKLGLDAAAIDRAVAQRVAGAVGERVSAEDFAGAAGLIGAAAGAGVLEDGEAQQLSVGVREGMGASAESRILRGMRMIRSGAETEIESQRVALQSAIDNSAWLLGESRALQLTVALNEATRDSVAKRAAEQKIIHEQQAESVWIQREASNLTNPGSGGFVNWQDETIVVPDADGNPVEITITQQRKREAALDWGYSQIDGAVGALVSDDPAARAEAWDSQILSTLRAMPLVGLYDGDQLSPEQAQAMAMFARVAYTIDTQNPDPRIAEQIGQAMAAGKATLTRLRSTGGEGPAGTAIEQWFGVYRNMKALGQTGTSNYFTDADQAMFAEIDRQFSYNLQTQGQFWASAQAAEDEMARRTRIGYSPIRVPDDLVEETSRRAAGVGWWTAKANGIANVFLGIGNLAAESSRRTGEVGRGSAAQLGDGQRAFDYFPTDYKERIKNPRDVEEYIRAIMQVNARSTTDLKSAADRAVEAFKSSHVVVNGWAVNIGSGQDAVAIVDASDSTRVKSELDRAIESFYEQAGGFEAVGVDFEDLIMRPENPDEAGTGWWVIAERSSGAVVGDPVNGVNRFRIEELAERARKRRYENAAERSRKAMEQRRIEDEKNRAGGVDIPGPGGTVRRFSQDAARLMAPGGGGLTPEDMEEMRRIDEAMPRGRDEDTIRRLRERGRNG